MISKSKDFFVSPDYRDYVLKPTEISNRLSVIIDNRPDLIHHYSCGLTSVVILKSATSISLCDAPFKVVYRYHKAFPPKKTTWTTFGTYKSYFDALKVFYNLIVTSFQEEF